MIGELSYFLGLQVSQLKNGIFISKIKYVNEVLKKFTMEDCKSVNIPMMTSCKLSKNDKSPSIDQIMYMSMIGSLLHLMVTRSDIL